MGTLNGKGLEQFVEIVQDAEKLARQMEGAINPDSRCVVVIMACCFIIEICRRNMPGTSLKEIIEDLPSYMFWANKLMEKSENEKSQEDE